MDARFPPWIGFCHNDLQYGNLLLFGGDSGSVAAGSGWAADGSNGDGTVSADGPADGAAAGDGEGVGGLFVKLIDYEYSTLNGEG
jgi:thiamine kinase-like enzyme